MKDAVLACIKKRPRKSGALYTYLRDYYAPAAIDAALAELVKEGSAQCVGGGLARADSIRRTTAKGARTERTEASQAANVFRVGLAVSTADRALVWQVRALHAYLSTDWELAVLHELSGKKSTAEKCRRNLMRLAERKEEHGL
jgi:hypothetical protein